MGPFRQAILPVYGIGIIITAVLVCSCKYEFTCVIALTANLIVVDILHNECWYEPCIGLKCIAFFCITSAESLFLQILFSYTCSKLKKIKPKYPNNRPNINLIDTATLESSDLISLPYRFLHGQFSIYTSTELISLLCVIYICCRQ